MELGLIGLGRMGANMSRRWRRAGHAVVGYARHAETVWLMVPAAAVEATLDELVPLLASGDAVVDGGNSYYRDDLRRSKALAYSMALWTIFTKWPAPLGLGFGGHVETKG